MGHSTPDILLDTIWLDRMQSVLVGREATEPVALAAGQSTRSSVRSIGCSLCGGSEEWVDYSPRLSSHIGMMTSDKYTHSGIFNHELAEQGYLTSPY
jgi:hypothetical protein